MVLPSMVARCIMSVWNSSITEYIQVAKESLLIVDKVRSQTVITMHLNCRTMKLCRSLHHGCCVFFSFQNSVQVACVGKGQCKKGGHIDIQSNIWICWARLILLQEIVRSRLMVDGKMVAKSVLGTYRIRLLRTWICTIKRHDL